MCDLIGAFMDKTLSELPSKSGSFLLPGATSDDPSKFQLNAHTPCESSTLTFWVIFSKVHFSGPCFSFQDSSKVAPISQ